VPGETHDQRGFLRAHDVEKAVARLAGAQHRVASTAQLEAIGLTARTAQHRASIGRFVRWSRGVYVLGPGPLTADGHRMAATLAGGKGAVLSHAAAAAAWGLLVAARGKEQVTVVGDGSERARLRVHGTRRLDARDVTVLRGVPVTTVARTLVDLAGDPRLGRAFHEAEVLGLLDVAAVTAALDRVRGRAGTWTLRALIADADAGVTRSELEDRFAQLCRAGGLPPAPSQRGHRPRRPALHRRRAVLRGPRRRGARRRALSPHAPFLPCRP
jgi:predicted transcriptional regulator of viral defense system